RADVDAYVAGVHRAPDGTPTGVNALALDPSSFHRTFQVLEGALPDEKDTTAIVVNRAFADQFALGVGDAVDLRMFGPDQFDAVNDGKYDDPTGPEYTFSIAAIVRVPPDIVLGEVRAP